MRRMLQRALLLCAGLVLLFAPAPFAEGIIEENGVRYILSDDVAVILGFEAGMDSAVIPPTVRSLPTCTWETEPCDMADVSTLIFAEGVTSLDAYKGLFGERVRRVEVPDSAEIVPENYYNSWITYASGLETLKLPAGVTEEAFSGFCDAVREAYWYSGYDLSDYVTAFYDRSETLPPIAPRSFARIEIDAAHPSLYDVDGVVFQKETNALVACMPGRSGGYTVPEGTTAIGAGAFSDCDQLESLILPRSVTSIESRAFSGCAGLTAVHLPPTLRRIGSSAFDNCISLPAIVLPNGVNVESGAFRYCIALRAVYALGSNSTIEPDAFRTAGQGLVIYAPKDTAGYHAAAANHLLWAEPGGEPARLVSPAYVYAAIAHAQGEAELLPLYAGPERSSEVFFQCSVGTTVEVRERLDGWARVVLQGDEGYMPDENLVYILPEEELERVLAVETVDSVADFYTYPTLSAPYIRTEGYFSVIQRFGTWYMVDFKGETRYVPAESVQPRTMDMESDVCVVSREGAPQRAALYKAASKDSECLGYYYNGTQVKRLEWDSESGFSRVRVGGQEGYMENEAITSVWAEWFYYAG